MHISDGGGGSGAAIAPCAFQLDVQWIIDIIDRIQSLVKKVARVADNVLAKAEKILRKLSGILSWFCWLPLGKFAKTVVEHACKLIRMAVRVMSRIYDRILEAMKHVLAPWEVRSAGEQIRDDLAPKCADFAQMVHAGNLKSTTSWTGKAAELFQISMERQYTTANDVATGAKEFGTTVQEIGANGVSTTVTFVTSLITAIAGIIAGALEMAAVPVGTPIGAAQIMGLVAAIFTYIMVYVTAMLDIIKQSSALNQAASKVQGGQWPKARL